MLLWANAVLPPLITPVGPAHLILRIPHNSSNQSLQCSEYWEQLRKCVALLKCLEQNSVTTEGVNRHTHTHPSLALMIRRFHLCEMSGLIASQPHTSTLPPYLAVRSPLQFTLVLQTHQTPYLKSKVTRHPLFLQAALTSF